MSLPALTMKSMKSTAVVDSIDSVCVVVEEERKQQWEEGKREETSRRLQFLFVLFLNNPRSEFSERVDGIRATRSWTRVLEKAASRRGDAGPG